jgi:hypothetical protein
LSSWIGSADINRENRCKELESFADPFLAIVVIVVGEGVSRIDHNSAMPIDTFQRFRNVHPMCSENNDVAFGRLLLGSRDGGWPKISDEISQCLRASGIGYNYGMTSGYQMAAERTRYVTSTYKF